MELTASYFILDAPFAHTHITLEFSRSFLSVYNKNDDDAIFLRFLAMKSTFCKERSEFFFFTI